MGAKAPKPCRTCKLATHNANGYCDKHEANAVGWNQRQSAWAGKGSSRKWYERIRPAVLKRDFGLCVLCVKAGRPLTSAVVVDHIIPKFEGGTDAFDNLQSLCKACHDAKTAQESMRARKVGGR